MCRWIIYGYMCVCHAIPCETQSITMVLPNHEGYQVKRKRDDEVGNVFHHWNVFRWWKMMVWGVLIVDLVNAVCMWSCCVENPGEVQNGNSGQSDLHRVSPLKCVMIHVGVPFYVHSAMSNLYWKPTIAPKTHHRGHHLKTCSLAIVLCL